MNRYKKHYNNIVCYDLLFKDHFINIMQLPKIDNIILNIGLGKNAILDKKQIVTTLTALELITGQKSCQTRAKKSIDKFKLRQNMPIGCKVTLRNKNMFNFMDKLTNKVLPNMDEISDLIASTETRRKKTNVTNGNFFVEKSLLQRRRCLHFEPSINKALQNQVGLQPNHKNLQAETIPALGGRTNHGNSSFGDSSNFPYFVPLFFNNLSVVPNASNFSRRERFLSSKKASKGNENILSINFGISDFFYFNEIPYDKFSSNSSYGLNIIIRITRLKKKKSNHLLHPNYFLSSFQLPLGIPA